MGKTKRPLPVKLVVGMISARVDFFQQAQEKLSQEFGIVDFESKIIPFAHTDYYTEEMGENLNQHRFYLGKGICGEITLRYIKKSFQAWEWTYPDYGTEHYLQIFYCIRTLYRPQEE